MIEKTRTVRRLLISVAVLVALLVAAVLAAPMVVPSRLIATRIAALVQQKSGRELRIAGPISFSLVPRFGLVAHDVHLSSPAGGFSRDFLSADEIDVSLRPSALLDGAIEVDQLAMSHPSITFEIDASGERNWIFHPVRSAPSPASAPTGRAAAPSFAAGDMTIRDGTLSYIDDRSQTTHTVTAANLTVSMQAFEQPLSAKGSAIYNGEALEMGLALASLQSLGDEGGAQVTLGLTGRIGSFNFTGTVQDRAAFKAIGATELKIPSLHAFLAWAGVNGASDIDRLDDFTLTSHADLDGDRLRLTGTSITLDGVASHGNLTLTRLDKRFDLALDDLSVLGGGGSGKLSIDTAPSPPAMTASGKLAGVAFSGLPVGIAGFESLSGTGDMTFDFTASGKTARQLIASLSGTANVEFAHGSVESEGLGGLKNRLGPALNDKIVPHHIEYRSLSASATIAQGVLHNTDLQLVGPRVSATGSGTLDLSQRHIDYEWQPDIIGLGNAQITISGAWDAPTYTVESLNITKGLKIHGFELR